MGLYPAKRNAAIDILRIVLATMVVANHTSFHGDGDSALNFMLMNGLYRLAVPTFFIINGYFLFGTIRGGRPIWPYLKRILILYLLWTLIYIPFFYPGFDSPLKIYLFFRTILIGYFHLWYLVALMGGILVLYLLRRRSDRELLMLAAILFLIGCAMQFAASHIVFGMHKLNSLLSHDFVFRNFLLIGFPFVTLGYLIAANAGYMAFVTRHATPGLILVACLLVMAEGGVNFLFREDDDLDFLLMQFIAAPLLFAWCLNRTETFSTRLVADIATAIYLVHILVMKLLVIDAGFALGPQLFVATLTISAALATTITLIGQTRGPDRLVRYLF